MAKRKEWTNKFGQILESKKGNLYIKIEKPVTLNEGDIINMVNFHEELEKSLEAGKLDQDKYEHLSDKCSFVKYNLDLPPSSD